MISFGIDIGTTTTRAIALEIEHLPFNQKRIKEIASPLCAFTPFNTDGLNESEIETLLDQWIEENKLGTPDIGTLLCTGEAQRASNSESLLERLSRRCPGFLTAQLNPELETIVAAKGAKALELSASLIGQPVLHLDIGGGTSNLAWIENGKIVDTACLDLGARKWKLDPATGEILSKTRAGKLLEELNPQIIHGKNFDEASAKHMAERIASYLVNWENNPFFVIPWKAPKTKAPSHLSISGGIADCLRNTGVPTFSYGDLGPALATAITSQAKEENRKIHLSEIQGKATALGISAFGFQVSGGSIHFTFDTELKNVPLLTELETRKEISLPDTVAVFLTDLEMESARIEDKAKALAHLIETKQKSETSKTIFLMQENLAASLGFYLTKLLPKERQVTIIDEIECDSFIEMAPVRTVDIKKISNSDRFSVTLKVIQLF